MSTETLGVYKVGDGWNFVKGPGIEDVLAKENSDESFTSTLTYTGEVDEIQYDLITVNADKTLTYNQDEHDKRLDSFKETYADKRRRNYPSIGDQLDMIYHAGQGGDEFQAAIKAVKDAYPKPE